MESASTAMRHSYELELQRLSMELIIRIVICTRIVRVKPIRLLLMVLDGHRDQ